MFVYEFSLIPFTKVLCTVGALCRGSWRRRRLRESFYLLSPFTKLSLCLSLLPPQAVPLPRQMEATTYQRFGLRFGLTYLTGFACHPEPVEGSKRFIRVIGLV